MKLSTENKCYRLSLYQWLFMLLAMLILSSCASNKPIQFYLLDAELAEPPALASAKLSNSHLNIGLGPIHLPDYLNRPQLVQQVNDNEYKLDEYHRWGENLQQNIARSLNQLLIKRLMPNQLLTYPWANRQTIDYQVIIDIFKLHQTQDQHSLLEAQWQIKQAEQILMIKSFTCKLPSINEASNMVKAQSICLGNLAFAIEEGLLTVENSH